MVFYGAGRVHQGVGYSFAKKHAIFLAEKRNFVLFLQDISKELTSKQLRNIQLGT